MDLQNLGQNEHFIPKRFILTALGFWGMFNLFAMRVSLSVAIVAMVNSTTDAMMSSTMDAMINSTTHFSNITNFDAECPNLISQTEVIEAEKYIGVQYNWNTQTQSLILGAFYYGYVITQVPGGFLSEKIGGKWLFGGGILNTAIFCLLIPFVASWGASALFIVRIIQGLGEGATFPAINFMIGQWSPIMERSRLSAITFIGNPLENVLSMALSGWLCSVEIIGGWPSVFYVFGTISCVWFIFWACLVHGTPFEHPTISLKELQCFQASKEQSLQKKPKTPWKAIFSSLPMWAAIVALTGSDFGLLVLMAELPTYLSTALHFDIKETGVLSGLPFIFQAITGIIASYIADSLRRSNTLSITNIRKVFTAIGFFGPALCYLGITVAGCRPYLIVCLITLGMALNGCGFSGFNVIHVDMSPTFAGTLYAIGNTAACCCGFIGPAIVGFLTDSGATMANWDSVFYFTAAIYIISAAIFAAFASAELQPWGDAEEEQKPKETDGILCQKIVFLHQ